MQIENAAVAGHGFRIELVWVEKRFPSAAWNGQEALRNGITDEGPLTALSSGIGNATLQRVRALATIGQQSVVAGDVNLESD